MRLPRYLFAARFWQLIRPLLTSWLIETESIPGPPPVRAFSFFQCLRHLLMNDFGVPWTLQWCACLSSFVSLICRSCSSVPDFVVSLPSVLVSRQTTLRLTNVSGRYSRTQGTCTLWKKKKHPADCKRKICIFDFFLKLSVGVRCSCRAHTPTPRRVMQTAQRPGYYF